MRALLFLFLFYVGIALAQSDVNAEVRDLQSRLATIQQEQQSVYQQFQMLQTLKKEEEAAANPQVIENSPVYSMDNAPPNYEDVVRDKAARHDRIQQYGGELNTLFARYQELEQQKQPLVARLRELTTQPR
jgi:hypothetical protein